MTPAGTSAADKEPDKSPSTRWPSLTLKDYPNEPLARRLFDFFQAKGLAAIKEEDRREQWYADWVAYQAEHQLYARLLCPKELSTCCGEFDVLRYARFLELFAYFSPAHGYSLQVTFLGFFAILTGTNAALKREAAAALQAGGLLALGVSEQAHGSDLLANEFAVTATGPNQLRADGRKYYIGNSNLASMISVLARKAEPGRAANSRRAPFLLFALRPDQSPGFRNVRKIPTLGVRAAYVGEFEVRGHEFPVGDVIAQGRDAWDAVFGTVTLGKFFLGFGAVGVCLHAFEEAMGHLRNRMLYGSPAIEMPHIRAAMTEAYARLTAMRLYAYRALDYVRTATAADRRYLLFCAVQKARVSTQGVTVMSLISECVGAKGFEADTYIEMALRDVQLFPGLEGNAHINLAMTARFIDRYFSRPDGGLIVPPLGAAGENPYLMEARAGGADAVAFPTFLDAYRPLRAIPNVRRFVRQVKVMRLLFRGGRGKRLIAAGADGAIAAGKCLATIAYAQLVAEGLGAASTPSLASVIFGTLVADLSNSAFELASSPHLDPIGQVLAHRAVSPPATSLADVIDISRHLGNTSLA